MKNRRRKVALVMICSVLCTTSFYAQVTQFGNNITTLGPYIGCDGFSNQPLRFTTMLNFPHEWRTSNILHMRLLPTTTAQTINTYPGLTLSGNLGVGLFNSPLVNRPFSLLHLDAGGFQDSGFRPWMQSGMTITRQSDQSYFGLKDEGNAQNHTVVAWSDNSLADPGPDYLKFIFLADNVGTTGVAGSLDGLEAARFTPDITGNEAFFGVGDYFTAGTNPSERVDVLDGKVAIRDLPNDPQSVATQMVVVRPDGVLEQRPMPIGGTPDCDWTFDASGNLITAVVAANNGPCPDVNNRVGIGIYNPAYKLDVYASEANAAITGGMRVGLNAGSVSWRYGGSTTVNKIAGSELTSVCGTISTLNNAGSLLGSYGAGYAVYGISRTTESDVNITHSHGVYGRGYASAGNVSNLYGGKFLADGVGSVTNAFGIRAQAYGAMNNWAGYFDGNVHIQGIATCMNMIWGSDASIKTNVEPITGAMDRIMQLQPSTYEFLVDEHPAMGLPSGEQRGLIAQQAVEVFPSIVSDIYIAALVDSAGTEIYPAETIKGVNYVALIPELIAGMQEQQILITEQRATIQQMQDQINSCCSNQSGRGLIPVDDDNSLGNGTDLLNLKGDANDRTLRIQPNPFKESTTVYYQLEQSGRMQLIANSADGKQLRVLHEANMEQGSYQFEWNTADLAPGTYYVTLLLDGKPLTKKAVKMM